MGNDLVSLNVNPCKMCMPMGAVSALAGIKNCMSILHGSQGCATYIRRHMATHYNEPVDIASSSLTEHGTVFGGRENLIKGLGNLIKLYRPDVIGVATTCLAETIGEDVPAIVREFYDTHPDTGVKIITIPSAGYGGTQYEGFNIALWSLVTQTDMDPSPNDLINIITPMLSPADGRQLKKLLDDMGLRYVLLPDLSDNLDGIHADEYERLKPDGTALTDISKMAGARHTIELMLFNDPEFSPAKYLWDTYGVPYTKLALPIGIRDTDALLDALVSLGGVRSDALVKERGRYIDAMVDSHKYCAEGRAAVYGEPDFVYSMARLCCENGTVPLVCATGSVCSALQPALAQEAEKAAGRYFAGEPVILDDCDFDLLERHAREKGVNLMLGNSDGRRMARRLNVPLVRCAFPVHDQVGGQRIKTLLYEGSLNILDQSANALLGRKDESFREEMYDRYFNRTAVVTDFGETAAVPDIKEKTRTHPCFCCSGGEYARIHLPVAPACNIQCNYCVRKYDCPNESRPGVTTQVLSPDDAAARYIAAREQVKNLTVVGIAGPGDALCDFDRTRETLRKIRKIDPSVTFCLSTNGLMLPLYAQELIELGVSHVTVTVNAVDPVIGATIYSHVEYMGKRYISIEAASILLANQLAGLRYLSSRGVVCKVNTVVLRGVNDSHVEAVVQTARDLGAYVSNIMQLIPVPGSAFENLELISNRELAALRKKCQPILRQMYHCRQCRADAVGTLNDDRSIEYTGAAFNTGLPATAARLLKRYAVASKNGMLVDQHFGHARVFYLYESDGRTVRFIEKRAVTNYCTGAEDCIDDKEPVMERILESVSDCSGVLALRIGNTPARKLKSRGIDVITTYDRTEDAVLKAAAGHFKKEVS